MDPRHAVLFEPLSIGPKTLRNRFYQVPHASGFGTTKAASQAAFRAIKAEGGWAAVCTDYASISSDSEESPVVSADFWDGDDMRALALMTEQVHAHGALAGIELFHGGSGSSNAVSRRPLLAPSAIAGERLPYSVPKSMDSNDIERVQRLWVDAALRARDTGFDIVYVYGAHAYLLGQFLSPYFNKRTDGYGGALVARARMWLETLHRVRDAVGADCAIATRLTVDGRGTPGIEIDEALEFVRLADPLVDLWDVNAGSWPLDSGTSRYFPQGHQLPFTGRVREATDKPIVSVGRFTDADTMAALVRSGTIDVIGAARPAIADPFLPRKIAEGRLDEIRECTGSNVCILKEESFLHLGCVQNATAGEEHRRGWHPERFPPLEHPDKAVLVVGAGAAGMECAIVLGRPCSVVPSEAAGTYGLSASFAGDGNYVPSGTGAPFIVTQEETTIVYTGPTVIAQDNPVTLSGRLLEDGVTPIAGRMLTLTIGSGATAQSCTTTATDAGGNAQCTIIDVTVGQGPQPVQAAFAGDAYYLPSADNSHQVTVFAFPSRGAFVLGDTTVATGPPLVTFWGAQWTKQNVVSNGGATPAFKGFAKDVSSNPPACGGTWTSSPGNSSSPVALVPVYMGTLVTSSVTKKGSSISGTITKIVVVVTAPGYGADPGHPGTGTIVATYCG